jgi:4Fe-4S ferredoxin
MGGDDRGRARSNSSKSVGIIRVRQSMTRKPVDSCKQAAGVFGPVVSLKRCEGKGDCVEVCPEHVFRVQRIEENDYRRLNVLHKFKLRVHGMRVAYTPNADACLACGLCVTACPEQAITLRRRDAER